MPIKRGQIDTNIGTVQKADGRVDMVNRANVEAMQNSAMRQASNAGGGASEIVGALSRFAGAVGDESMRQAQRNIELDKIKQTHRAVGDLAKPVEERLGISEDATVAGQTAYNLIQSQRAITDANSAITAEIANNPAMTDDEFESLFDANYGTILEGAQSGSPELFKAVTLQAQEAQVQLYAARKSAQVTRQREDYLVTASDELAQNSSNVINKDFAKGVDEDFRAKANAMGIDEMTQRNMLIAQASNSAMSGNPVMLEYLEGQKWAVDNPELATIRTNYENQLQKNNFIERGVISSKVDLLSQTPNVPWSEVEKVIQENSSIFTEADVKRMHSNHLKTQKGIAKTGVAAALTMTKEGVPLNLRDDLTQQDKKNVVGDVEATFVSQYNDGIRGGENPLELTATLAQAKLAWSQKNNTKLPSLTQNMQSIIGLNPEIELDDSSKHALSVLKVFGEKDIRMYFPNKADADFARNLQLQLKREGEGGEQNAVSTAYNMRNNPKNVTSDMKRELRDDLSGLVESNFSHLFSKDIPSWMVNNVAGTMYDAAEVSAYNTGSVEGLADREFDYQKENFTQISNGTLINTPVTLLQSNLGYSKPDSEGQVKPRPDLVIETFDHFLNVVEDTILSDIGLKSTDVAIEPYNNGNFRLMSRYGDDLGIFSGADIRKVADDSKKAGWKIDQSGRRVNPDKVEAQKLEYPAYLSGRQEPINIYNPYK